MAEEAVGGSAGGVPGGAKWGALGARRSALGVSSPQELAESIVNYRHCAAATGRRAPAADHTAAEGGAGPASGGACSPRGAAVYRAEVSHRAA